MNNVIKQMSVCLITTFLMGAPIYAMEQQLISALSVAGREAQEAKIDALEQKLTIAREARDHQTIIALMEEIRAILQASVAETDKEIERLAPQAPELFREYQLKRAQLMPPAIEKKEEPIISSQSADASLKDDKAQRATMVDGEIIQGSHRNPALVPFEDQLAILREQLAKNDEEYEQSKMRSASAKEKLAAEAEEFKSAFMMGFFTGLVPVLGTGYLLTLGYRHSLSVGPREMIQAIMKEKYGYLKVATLALAHGAGIAAAYYGYQTAQMLLSMYEGNPPSYLVPKILGLALQAACMGKTYAKNKSFFDVASLMAAEFLVFGSLYLLYKGGSLVISNKDIQSCLGLMIIMYVGCRLVIAQQKLRAQAAH